MKSTKIMFACIASFLITWLSVATIVYMLSDVSFKLSATHGGTMMLMLIFGWIPAVIVGYDLDKQLKD